MYTVKLKKEVTRKNLRVGSVLEDLNGERHTVIRLDDYFIVTTYGKGEMRLDEMKWENYATKMYLVSGYESDNNTPKISRKHLIPLNSVFGEGYDNLALQVRNGAYNNIYHLYKLIGNVIWIDAEVYIHPYSELDELQTAIDNRKNMFTTESFLRGIRYRCENGGHIKLSEMNVLNWLNEGDLYIDCVEARKVFEEKRQKEEAEAREREEERKRKYIEEMEKQYAEEKDKVITGIINNCIVKNVECDNGKNVIVSMCEECGIKIPIRTKGFILDKTKFNAFRCESNGSITIWGKGTSKKVWDILGQLCEYYK